MTEHPGPLATGKGKFTPMYPELGTGPVSYEDCISEEFFAAERKAVFERTWLCVGRMERLPRRARTSPASCPGRLASIVVTRDLDGNVHAFHNVCAHRGNKVVWQEHPQQESAGSCREFACKYHGWRYGLDGCVTHVTNEEEFFDLDKSSLRMPTVHCEVFAGLHLRQPRGAIPVPLRDVPRRADPRARGLPVRSHDPALRLLDPHPGQLEARRRLGVRVVPPAVRARPVHRPRRVEGREDGAARRRVPLRPVPAPHAHVGARAAVAAAARAGQAGEARQDQRWVYKLFRAGLFGPDDVPDIGPLPEFLNKGEIASWGNDQFWLFPNLSIQIWARNYYITYTYWPETVDSHIYEIDLYFVPPANAHERLAQELVVDSTIEFAMQDVNTIEATHSALATRAQTQFNLSDQELLIRQFHTVIRDTVAAYQADDREQDDHDRTPRCPTASPSSSRTSTTGRSRHGPSATRRGCRSRIDELVEFYDAIAPRAEEAIDYLDALDLNDLPDDATRLLQLLYSMILVSYAVNIFKQPRIPDSGAAFFDMVAEPAL